MLDEIAGGGGVRVGPLGKGTHPQTRPRTVPDPRPLNRITGAGENITFPRSTYVVGNDATHLLVFSFFGGV